MPARCQSCLRLSRYQTAVAVSLMRLRDDALCAGIAVIAFVVGLIYLNTSRLAGVPAYFYQSDFGPAVMAACGRGFVNPVVTPSSPLTTFLQQSTPELRCNQLDRDIPQTPLTPFQTTTTYLLRAAGRGQGDA